MVFFTLKITSQTIFQMKEEEEKTTPVWIFYLYFVAVVYYCCIPDAWLVCTWFYVNLSLVVLFLFCISFIHTIIKHHIISQSVVVVFDSIPFHSIHFSSFVHILLYFIPFCLVDDMILSIFWYIANVIRYGRVRLEILSIHNLLSINYYDVLIRGQM